MNDGHTKNSVLEKYLQELYLQDKKKLSYLDVSSLGSRELSKKLCEEGFSIGRYATHTLMRKLSPPSF